MEQRLTIITLGVKNLIEATAFYQEKFGWKKLDSSNNGISFFQLNGMLLSLYPLEELAQDALVPANGSGFKAFTLAYVARSIAEVDEIFAAFAAKNVKIVKPPAQVFWGGYSGYVADIDDNLWEIAFNPFLALDENGNAI